MSTLTSWPLTFGATAHLLRHWSVGKPMFLRAAPGTASPAVVVTTRRGQCFLKQRSPRYSSPGWLAYDHSVIRYLARCALPVTPPLKTADGRRWVVEAEHVYELYPFVSGEPCNPTRPEQIAAAGELLARLHECTTNFQPSGHKPMVRLCDPRDRLSEIAEARALLEAGADPGAFTPSQAAARLDLLQGTAEGLLRRVPDARLRALPQVIVHGDFHPANLKYEGDRVVGLFDFDWVCRQARLKDVADAVLFFAPRERPLAADLAGLTQAPRFDLAAARRLLQPYLARQPLTAEEAACLGDLLRERWLYVRLDAMHRKVPPERKLAFLLPEVEVPLRWLDGHEGELKQALTGGARPAPRPPPPRPRPRPHPPGPGGRNRPRRG